MATHKAGKWFSSLIVPDPTLYASLISSQVLQVPPPPSQPLRLNDSTSKKGMKSDIQHVNLFPLFCYFKFLRYVYFPQHYSGAL
jgi:hypothetical protein